MKKVSAVGLAMTLLLGACDSNSKQEQNDQVEEQAYATPIHSYARPNEAVVKHLNLDISVAFKSQSISGRATYDVEVKPGQDRIVFDTRNLTIKEVLLDGIITTDWWLGEEKEFLGQPLEIKLSDSTKQVGIEYATQEGADALQWLSPQQTAGKEHPFLFTQSQAILARTWLPCQDSPGIRYTYDAKVQVPSDLMALMSASNPTSIDSSGVYTFKMEQPIPSYLMALSVGHLEFSEIGDRTGVYAEPSVIEAAAYEFADMQKMLESAEKLYGPYAWERYDVIVLPPSFPFGGMENPRLTFATPTILAGDRSLTALVAHELAHSWSGNLVTNSTWNDFWLNEGFTVYFERRIMEDVYGKDYANMLAILGRQDLDRELESLANKPNDTKLKLNLQDRDPDDGMSDIAYEKGYMLLRTMEENVGREKFDAFLKTYFTENAFKTMTTEAFLDRLKDQLFDGSQEKFDALQVNTWVYEPGIPDNCVNIESSLFAQVEQQLDTFMGGAPASAMDTADWTTHQWLHFLRSINDSISLNDMAKLDRAFGFTQSGNSEIAAEWYVLAINRGYAPADEAIEQFLIDVGRRKFLSPIYGALVEADPSMERARTIYQKARPNYHSVSTNTLDALLNVTP